MSFNFVKKLPTPAEIREQYPVSDAIIQVKKERDEMIRKVFTGESDKFLVIIGPCSADNEDAVLDYVHRLARVQEKVSDKLILIPRIYTNKPRTTGEGYKGMVHQPDPEKKPDMLAGILAIRHMHMRAVAETGLTAADEMLYPENWRYLSDILSYVAVGARSVENQQHRLTVSGIDIPAGMKNPTSGDLLYQFHTADELKKYLLMILKEVCEKNEENENELLIENILVYLENHYADDITLNELAEHKYFVSVGHLSRTFKNKTGLTFSKYLTEVRLKKAKEFLGNTDFDITDIAAFTGYNDASYFTQIFRKSCGMTPSEYRSLERKKKNQKSDSEKENNL